MLFTRSDEQQDEQFSVHFIDPSRRRFVGLDVDEPGQRARPFLEQEQDLSEQPHAMQSYWGCVQTCLRNGWREFPQWARWVCGAGCGSCIWGLNPWNCGGCATCLGGYAGGCLGACAAAT